MTLYRTIAKLSIQVITILFFVIFIFVSYHRLMPLMMSLSVPMDMSTESQGTAMPVSSCEGICLLGASLNWQQTAEGVYALRVVEFNVAVLLSFVIIVFQLKFSLADIVLGQLVKLGLYYKYRWRLSWIRYWSHIYQRGIIPARLYA